MECEQGGRIAVFLGTKPRELLARVRRSDSLGIIWLARFSLVEVNQAN